MPDPMTMPMTMSVASSRPSFARQFVRCHSPERNGVLLDIIVDARFAFRRWPPRSGRRSGTLRRIRRRTFCPARDRWPARTRGCSCGRRCGRHRRAAASLLALLGKLGAQLRPMMPPGPFRDIAEVGVDLLLNGAADVHHAVDVRMARVVILVRDRMCRKAGGNLFRIIVNASGHPAMPLPRSAPARSDPDSLRRAPKGRSRRQYPP